MATYYVRVSSTGREALPLYVPLEEERSIVSGGIRMSVKPIEVEIRSGSASESSATPEVPALKAALKRFSGQVEDPSGAVIPNSAITIKKWEKSSQTFVADIRTDSRGSFSADLPSGAYRATFKVPGFISQNLNFSIGTNGWRGPGVDDADRIGMRSQHSTGQDPRTSMTHPWQRRFSPARSSRQLTIKSF
jgi:hypothetical protein